MGFVERLSIREIARRTGRDRKTVQRAIRSDAPPRYARTSAGSKLDPFKDEIGRLLSAEPIRRRTIGSGCQLFEQEVVRARPVSLPGPG
jgi:transposase